MGIRKILLATTALGLMSGTAAAEITLSGDAEMGVAGSKDDSARLHTDVNVKFTLSGTTDGGVTFGSAVELAESGDGSRAVDDDDEHGGISVYMKGPFGNLEMGDTDGAFDWAMAETNAGGLRDDAEHAAWTGNSGLDGTHDGQILRYDYSFGGFGFGASVELDDKIAGKDPAQDDDGKPVFGVGGKYSMGMADGLTVGVGAGFQMGSTATEDRTILGGSVELGTAYGLKAVANLSSQNHEARAEGDGSETTVTRAGFGLSYATGPFEIGGNVGAVENDHPGTENDSDVTGVGLAASYDLGGGAKVLFGVGSDETDHPEVEGRDSRDTDGNRWSLGVAFSF